MATTMALRDLGDSELIMSARKGDPDAYGELYRRHVKSARAAARALTRSRADADDVTSEAFARVLRALQAGGGPTIAFRPYLVTAVRHVVFDRSRRNREDPTDHMSDEINVVLLEAAGRQEDGAFAAAAFAALPERWQLVLWHTEVEGRSVSEVAPMLGLAPNAVAALAYRAREGLRQAYLQAHLRPDQDATCRECAANLGAYVRDGLSARDRRRTDAHLEGCDSCTALVAELADTNNLLRAALIPALIGIAPKAYLAGLGGKGLLLAAGGRPSGRQLASAGGAVAAAALVAAIAAGALGGGGSAGPSASATTTTRPAGGEPALVAPDHSAAPAVPREPAATAVPATLPATVAPVSTAAEPPTTVARSAPASTVPPSAPTSTVQPASEPPVTEPLATVPLTTLPVTTEPATTVPASTVPVTTLPATTVPATTTTLPSSAATLSVAVVQRSPATRNGSVLLDAVVTNGGTSAVTGVRVELPAPPGSSFTTPFGALRVAAPGLHPHGWSCDGDLSCTLPALAPGHSSVMTLVLFIADSAPASITITPSVSSPSGATVTISPITIDIEAATSMQAAVAVARPA